MQQRKKNASVRSSSGMDSLSFSYRSDCSAITTILEEEAEPSLPPRRNSALDNFMQGLLAGRETELIIDSARSSPCKSWDSSSEDNRRNSLNRTVVKR
ncbi:unnamed protein product [Cylindrotheca closterium]|uniref:Uncharacterized protein n=1 Tax=Cylindrotheca closterium TaxID=2856 RepID=A0AAD2GEK9_9STRA|nr:unnamed protein product [Cylindrotheca closterium]